MGFEVHHHPMFPQDVDSDCRCVGTATLLTRHLQERPPPPCPVHEQADAAASGAPAALNDADLEHALLGALNTPTTTEENTP